jgi:hypothetical protein
MKTVALLLLMLVLAIGVPAAATEENVVHIILLR